MSRRPDAGDDEYFTSVVDTSHDNASVPQAPRPESAKDEQPRATLGFSLRTKILIGGLALVAVSGASIVALLLVEDPQSEESTPPTETSLGIVTESPLDPGQCNLAIGSPLPSFDPPHSNLVLWLRSDKGLVHNKATGSEIDTWNDLSGKGHHFQTNVFRDYPTERTPDEAPIAVPRASGCFPSVRFSGGQALQRSDTLGMAPEAGKTYLVVMRLAERARRTQVFGHSLPLDLQHHVCLETNTWHTRGNRFGVYVMGASFDSNKSTHRDLAVHVLRVKNLSKGAPLVEMGGQPSVLTYRVNGAPIELLQTAGPTQVSHSPAKLTHTAIGRCVGPGHSYLRGDVFEILVYDTALSEEQVEAVENGLISKYGIH